MLFADFLNWAMYQTGLTNYKLAKRIGVSQTTVANWANGTTEPRERRRSEVLDLFGVNEMDLEEGFPDIHYKKDSEKKEKPPDIGELSEIRKEAWDMIQRMDDDTLRKFIRMAKAALEE